MRYKICLIFTVLLLLSTFIYSQTVAEYPGASCNYDSETRIEVEKKLLKAYKEAKKAILYGREGRKLPQCKIEEIAPKLSKIKIIEYGCKGCVGCGRGDTEHPFIIGVALVLICEPLNIMRLQHHPCGCLEGLMVHEIIHATTGGDEAEAVDCSKILYPCALDPHDYETSDHRNCNCGNNHFLPSNLGGDNPDDNFSAASPKIFNENYESRNSDLLILKHGFYRETGALINRLKRGISYIESDQSPLEMKEAPPILVIPSGGLYGLEKSEQFKSILRDYVSQGGAVIVFSQQHGYEFSVLPTPDGEPIGAYGWREDQSCRSNSMYVDNWHPALSSATKSLISSPIDGYFAGYPPDSTALLSRRINGMPAMLAYPYGEGRVVVTSMFEDWGNSHGQSTIQGRSIIRDLITWAKNPDLEIPEYNLRDNPDPEVSLNLELKNLSDKTASKAKVLWLDPDRNLYFEEDKIISIPAGGNDYS